jgi:hypothetical protein
MHLFKLIQNTMKRDKALIQKNISRMLLIDKNNVVYWRDVIVRGLICEFLRIR